MRVRLPLWKMQGAIAQVIPSELAQLETVESIRPDWLGRTINMPVTANITVAAPAQLSVFDQEIEVIQPLRLIFSAEINGDRRSKTHDFILSARYGFDVDQDWNLILVELEPARFQGLLPPPLFGSINPDLSALMGQTTEVLGGLRVNLMTILNAEQGLRARMAALAQTFAVPGNQETFALRVQSAHVNDVRLDSEGVQMAFVLNMRSIPSDSQSSASQPSDSQGSLNLPPLSTARREAGDMQIPIAFPVDLDEFRSVLQQHLGPHSLAGGQMTIRELQLIGIHDQAMVVRVDADQIDPGGIGLKNGVPFIYSCILVFMGQRRALGSYQHLCLRRCAP